MTRITDLEEFALRHIWRPYQNRSPFEFERRLESLPYNLGDTTRMLSEKSEWSEAVLNRIAAIGFTFPAYIVHPLVDLIKTEQKARRAKVTP